MSERFCRHTVIDVAGAGSGGAARWRQEAEDWLLRRQPDDVRLIGEDQRVEARWLIRREFAAGRGTRVAANNVSFIGGSAGRIVLLRNALHFLRPREWEAMPLLPAEAVRQAWVVRTLARRADRVVVPSSDMAARVAAALRGIDRRLVVRFHPVSGRCRRQAQGGQPYVLYPSLPVAHKDLYSGLCDLLESLRLWGGAVRVKVTAPPAALGHCAGHPMVDAIGRQSLAEMDDLWAWAVAAYVPYTVESFCYPLAEARVAGIPVIAKDTAHNREIAGAALCGFSSGDLSSLACAVGRAFQSQPPCDPSPFDPDRYFQWLTTELTA